MAGYSVISYKPHPNGANYGCRRVRYRYRRFNLGAKYWHICVPGYLVALDDLTQ